MGTDMATIDEARLNQPLGRFVDDFGAGDGGRVGRPHQHPPAPGRRVAGRYADDRLEDNLTPVGRADDAASIGSRFELRAAPATTAS
jgi:hypothetical protein